MEMLLFLNESYIFHRFHPRSEAYCLSPYSVCFKRLPRKKHFYLLKSVQDIRRVFGVVYC
ncbi:BFH_collapsed_G0039620.mRNA.1.CDS.1 [Saccharomyces cerevisiae]|nr:BGP_1a_G0038930.mRNA.1.CDS.1 [Saccharomyces cerevisiae]CAI6686231.1 BFH_HP1_G0039050.mRNA.1.CDS.1 [Saccharomyces cerevisiae]CAI7220831.1 BGP_1a_G0038930.mRNA.1.CDS.1 [Saccharomyces cerevisiae]CAI7259444.1 BFH_collapsed_G0039620.mRNA.1.CDS.1 [Saccharomyces cerevisiae]